MSDEDLNDDDPILTDEETKKIIAESDNEYKNLITDKDLTDDFETEIDVGTSKLENKTFGIQSMISDFEYRLRGFIWKANGDKYIYCGNPLCGERTIQKVMLLLDPFSKAVNMIGNKKNYTWQKQLLRTRLALASILTNAYDSDLKNFKEVWRTFTNLLFNLGDVILEKNSQNMLSGYFGIGNEYKGESNFGGKGKSEGEYL